MKKSTKAALAGLAFLAGCEIGIAIQLMKMIHNFQIRESAIDESIPDEELEAAIDEATIEATMEATMDDSDGSEQIEQIPVPEDNNEDKEN